MEDKKQNKSFTPVENKQVKIKMRQNRADASVVTDAKGEALVDVETAERLMKDGYADLVEEKGD